MIIVIITATTIVIVSTSIPTRSLNDIITLSLHIRLLLYDITCTDSTKLHMNSAVKFRAAGRNLHGRFLWLKSHKSYSEFSGIQSYGVSWNGGTPKSSILWNFPYKLQTNHLGVPHWWTPPYTIHINPWSWWGKWSFEMNGDEASGYLRISQDISWKSASVLWGQCRVHLRSPPRTWRRSDFRTGLPGRARARAWPQKLGSEERHRLLGCFEGLSPRVYEGLAIVCSWQRSNAGMFWHK